MASKTENGPIAASIAKDTTKTTTGEIIVLGKRKEPPLPPIITSTAAFSSSSSSSLKTLVDVAFERMFGYSWGTTFDLSSTISSISSSNNNSSNNNNSEHQQMVQIFGPLRTARILNQKWNVAAPPSSSLSSYGNYKDSIIASSSTTAQRLVYSFSSTSNGTSNGTSNANCEKDSSASISRKDKRMRLEEKDYKNIELPKHMIRSSVVPSQPTQSAQTTSSTTTTYNKNSSTSTSTSSNLDHVLKQIAGKKQMNTVEKTSKDWEGFKETDQTLQDDLERTAQSKNAYLVKQDFLNRVDQRKFELEKVERDRDRSRRAASSSSSSSAK